MGTNHDSAAVLLCAGEICSGIEEERLTRVKHTNKMPVHAIRSCLRLARAAPSNVDVFAYYGREASLDRLVAAHAVSNPAAEPLWTARHYFSHVLSEALDCSVDPQRMVFVDHHQAHAMSAYAVGPFSDALVITLDGSGDSLCGSVSIGSGGNLRRLLEIPMRDSLGFLYQYAIRFLGYGPFDDYKVMGLASYGNPDRFRDVFRSICQLGPAGRFTVELDRLWNLVEFLGTPRRRGEPITQVHKDLAAGLQEAIEAAVFHLLKHYCEETGLRYLCYAGGVAQNTTLNGKILRSGLFDGVFVQPASHDGGCALGAALIAHRQLAPEIPIAPMRDVYWGTDTGDTKSIRDWLQTWSECVDISFSHVQLADVANLLTNDHIVGWVQGRSEFGPRALGNRSILADPRRASTKDRINGLVKERESYRPFAPVVMEEYANDLFDMPGDGRFEFMTFTLLVREHARDSLAAVTHVDGTSRVQIVSRKLNATLWLLLDAFRRITGVPALLNTSFNHSIEPIVDSIDDALSCFLTTGLSHLVVGDYLVTKGSENPSPLDLVPTLPEHVRFSHHRSNDARGVMSDVFVCESSADPGTLVGVSSDLFEVFGRIDARRTIAELAQGLSADLRRQFASECQMLWGKRLIRLSPRRREPRHPQSQ